MKNNKLINSVVTIYIVTAVLIPFIVWRMYNKISWELWNSMLLSYLGGAIGGIATLIAIYISTNDTRRIQNESKEFDIKKIRISIQVEAAQKQRLLITQVRESDGELFYFIRKERSKIESDHNKYLVILLSQYDLKYNKLLEDIEKLNTHFRNNEYILNKLYLYYSKLNDIRRTIINSKENIIKSKNDYGKLRRAIEEALNMLDSTNGEIYKWLNDLEYLIVEKYMRQVLDKEDFNNILHNIKEEYY